MGKNVVVIGGGEVGVEVGMHLASHGAEVTVIEMQNELAADATLIHYRSMFEDAWNALDNFSSILGATCTAITDNSVSYRDFNGKEHSLKADSVVISTGMKARSDLAMLFYGTAKEFYMIGDCKKPGTIEQAMRTAFSTAVRI